MTGAGIAVVGASGGCGTTVMAAALTAWGGLDVRRVVALDGYGGGPHALWGLQVDRTVDHLVPVRDEVDAGHVQQIIRAGLGEWHIVAGPRTAAGYGAWSHGHAHRLGAALVDVAPWIADVGRGQHGLAQQVIARATGVVIMAPRSLDGADACQRLASQMPPIPLLVGALRRPGEEAVSTRSMRRLVGGVDVVEVPWDHRALSALSSAAPGRRGLRACVADIAKSLVPGV